MSDKKMKLDLKRPRSGIFVNETPHPVNSDIPYETYNPRLLQEKLEKEERTKYTLLTDGNRFYFPWLKGQDDMGEPIRPQDALRQECVNFHPVIFPIPNDLHKTFRAAVVFSNQGLIPMEPNLGPHRPLEVACLYVAYVESFSKNPDYWSADSMDSIIETGMCLCQRSIDNKYENPEVDFDILPEITEKESTIKIKLHLTGTLNDEPNILKALTLFFDTFNAGILCSENLYFLIWKRCADSFYIFDPNGRDVECKRDFINGKASLMAIHTVEHIVHLILNYSDVSAEADFHLYDIHLKDFGKLSKPFQLPDPVYPKKLYAVVNPFYAIIPGISGLPPIVTGKQSEENASMMISYLALVYSQIDPPKSWSVRMVNDLIMFGKKYHIDYTTDNRINKLNVVDLPEVLLFGNYRVLVEKKAFVTSGHIVDCWSFRHSQLTLALHEFFAKYNTGMLQVDAATFGMWKENDMIFVFDPFKRGPAGQVSQNLKHQAGCLQIHLNLDSLCRILYMNSVRIKTEGNFFLHGIHVKAIGTFNINRALEDATGFGTLQIKYPFDCDRFHAGEEPEEEMECEALSPPGDILTNTIAKCLSQLSVSPCERTCSERAFLQQQKKFVARQQLTKEKSIQSIPELFQIPEYDDVDVVDSVVSEFICDLMTNIERKTEKKTKLSIEASKILLQSDKRHLEEMKMRLKRGEDYDNVCVAFKTKPPVSKDITLEQELAIESNFTALPDGTWAIFGINELNNDSQPLKGILAVITAAALSSKYKVSTWSSDVIEYAFEASNVLEDRFWSYNHTLDLIFRKQIPKIQLGSTSSYIKVICTETVMQDKLKETLEKFLLQVNIMILICQGLSCLIIRRYNFLYVFMGCPCDLFGFRSNKPGPMCLLRFLELNALLRRIENACGRCGKFVVVPLELKNVTDPRPDKFAKRTPSQEEQLYVREFNEKETQRQRYKDKMKFIQNEIHKEAKRVRKFQKEKRHPTQQKKRKKISIKIPQQSSHSEDTEGPGTSDFAEEVEFYEESEESVEYKHTPSRPIDEGEEEDEMEDETILLPQLGYQLRDSDCLFKIQGTTALDGRNESAVDQIKPCYFASTVALLYAILRPLNHWDSRRIDKVINVAKTISKTSSNFNTAAERIIKNIDVDEFTFQVKVQSYTPLGTFGGNLEYKICKTIQTQRYFLIQLANVTFGVYCDKYFHLFDPYPSMEMSPSQDEPGDEEQPEYPENLPTQPELNTASWVLFSDTTAMLQYIRKRAISKDWKTEYQIHIVSVISYKTAPKRVQLLNLLTDEFFMSRKQRDAENLCTHPEEIEWLDIYPNLLIWSRLNRSNAVQRIRGTALTKEKNFDVEIPDKLYSLWGSIHPLSAVFEDARGKQHLAIDVVAICIVCVYQLSEWNTQILDSIVINGNNYYNESINTINRIDYEISLEHLNTSFRMGHLEFNVHLESFAYGYLYTRAQNELNLAAALTFFFTHCKYGIIQCMKRSIAIGKLKDGGFFMFECQSHGLPLFHSGEGAAYVLRATQLQILLYCIVMTFNVPYFNAQFMIHKVESTSQRADGQDDEEEG